MTIELPKMPELPYSMLASSEAKTLMRSYGLSCYEEGVRAERERAASGLVDLDSASTLRLRMGEMTAHETDMTACCSACKGRGWVMRRPAAAIRKGE